MKRLSLLLINLGCVLSILASNPGNAHALKLKDFLPRGKTDFWLYRESGEKRNAGGGLLDSWDFEKFDAIIGEEHVIYPNGSGYTGFKYFEGERGFSDYSVQRFTDSGLEVIKEVDNNALTGVLDSYSFFGPTSGSPKYSPALIAPDSFDPVLSSFEVSYKEYLYDSSGIETGVLNNSQSFLTQDFENITVPGGKFYALKVAFTDTQAASDLSSRVETSGHMYLGANIGPLKQEYTSTVTIGSESYTEHNVIELVNGRTGGFKVGKPEYPVVLIHGIDSDEGAWSDLEGVFRDMGLEDGDAINIHMDDRTLAQLTSADVTQPPSSGDYYTINFLRRDVGTGNPSDLPLSQSPGNEDSITKQGKGLSIAIDKIKDTTGEDKVILVGHSMGGLAARDYLQGNSYGDDVAQLVTIGTPHQGSFAARIGSELAAGEITNNEAAQQLQPYYGSLSAGARSTFISNRVMSGKDMDGNAIRDLRDDSVFLNGGNEFADTPLYFESTDVNSNGSLLNDVEGLNQKDWPALVDYVSLSSSFFTNVDEPNDGVVTVESQRLNHPTHSGRHIEISPGFHSFHLLQPSATADILRGLGYNPLAIYSASPIDLIILDPLGNRTDKNIQDIFGSHYVEKDFDFDGISEPWITLLNPLPGNYSIQVLPRADASPTETYTLGTLYNNQFLSLADRVLIQDIPAEPYGFHTDDFQPVVPEPSSFLLFGLGIAPLIACKRRKRPATNSSETIR